MTANNLANVSTVGFKGSTHRVLRSVLGHARGRELHRRRQRRVRIGSRAAVLAGQHRDHGQQPRPGDQRQRLLHHQQQRRAGVHARRRIPGQQRRLRGRRPAAPTCRSTRRSPTAATTPAVSPISLTTSESAPQATTNGVHDRQSAGQCDARRYARLRPRPIPTATTTRLRSRPTTPWAPRTPRRCTSSKARPPTHWNAQLYVDGNAVGTPQALDY